MPALAADRVDHALPTGHALPRGWQAYAIFGLMPVWWLLGLSMFIWPLVAIVLAASLAMRRRPVYAPRRFGMFLLMLGWMAVAGFQLSDGQVGPIVGVPAGFHVLRVVKRTHAGLAPFDDEVQKQIKDKLRNEIYARESKRYLEELKRNAHIERMP